MIGLYVNRENVVPDFDIEDNLSLSSTALIAGVDEVGRGPLAGPVTAAAIVLHRAKSPYRVLSKINDSIFWMR